MLSETSHTTIVGFFREYSHGPLYSNIEDEHSIDATVYVVFYILK